MACSSVRPERETAVSDTFPYPSSSSPSSASSSTSLLSFSRNASPSLLLRFLRSSARYFPGCDRNRAVQRVDGNNAKTPALKLHQMEADAMHGSLENELYLRGCRRAAAQSRPERVRRQQEEASR